MSEPKNDTDRYAASTAGVLRESSAGVSRTELEPGHDHLGALKSATIMIVDDEETTIDVLEACLQDAGYGRFVTTTDPTQAVELVGAKRPDVLLLDLNMPGVGGFDILKTLRADATLRHTPVIILTSSTDPETKLTALKLGASDFLGKPVDASELALRLRNTLAAKAYQDRLTYYDAVTNLPNRHLLIERLQRILKRAEQGASECAVMHVDLDRFKQINDALGRRVGDSLLKAVSGRLEKALRPGDLIPHAGPEVNGILARVGGDEFTMILPWVSSVDMARQVATRMLSRFSKPFRYNGDDLFVTCSVGIAIYPDDGDTVDSLLGNAEIAMAHAKQGGRNGFSFYSKSLNAQSLERLNLENQLRQALERNELNLNYQPKVDFRTGKIVGAEALMRWDHPTLGAISPVRFIPVAEETGLIGKLGAWSLLAACRRARAWQRTRIGPVRMSVNVSGQQFRRGNLPDVVKRVLTASKLQPQYLVLELTESILMEDPEEAAKTLHRIKKMGVSLSIDDFGTGYSSLTYLKEFPLDELKIDRSFVKGVPDDANDRAIVTAILGLAQGLGLKVVAEGVETEEQRDFLAERGCDEYQGYFFSRPIPPNSWPLLYK